MTVVRILYYVLTLVCLTLSTVLSYFGFLAHVGVMTPFFVAMIIIALLMCDIALQKRRENGDRLWAVLIAMVIPVILSGLSNFNHLYTLFKRDDVVRQALVEQYSAFRNDLTGTRATLLALPAIREQEIRRAQLTAELDQMRLEGTDPTKPGCAELCRGHMAQVQAIIGRQLANLGVPSPSAGPAAFLNFHERFSTAAWDVFNADPRFADAVTIRALVADIDAGLATFRSAEDAIAAGQGLDALATLDEKSSEIERRANSIPGIDVRHTRVDPLIGRLGQIPDTVRNAFVEMPDPTATAMSVFFAIVVDIFPLMMVLALLRPGEGISNSRSKSPLGRIV